MTTRGSVQHDIASIAIGFSGTGGHMVARSISARHVRPLYSQLSQNPEVVPIASAVTPSLYIVRKSRRTL